MKVRGYRITVNHAGVQTAASRVFTAAIIALVPYTVGRVAVFFWGYSPEKAKLHLPMPLEIWSIGAALIMMTVVFGVIALIAFHYVLGSLFDIEEVENVER